MQFFELPENFELCTGLKGEFIVDDSYIFANLKVCFGNRKYKLISKRKLNIILLAEFLSYNQFLKSKLPEYWNNIMKKQPEITDKLNITQNIENNTELTNHIKINYPSVDGYFSSLEDRTIEEFCFFNKNDFYIEEYKNNTEEIWIKGYERVLNSIKIRINISDNLFIKNIYTIQEIDSELRKIIDECKDNKIKEKLENLLYLL